MDLAVNPDLDLCYIPFEPVAEDDTLEIRLQIANRGAAGVIEIAMHLDGREPERCFTRRRIQIPAHSRGFCNVFHSMAGLAGAHTLHVAMADTAKPGADPVWIAKPLAVRQYAPNLIEGSFFLLASEGKPNTASFARGLTELTDRQWAEQVDSFNEIGIKTLVMMSSIQFADIKYRYTPEADRGLRAHYASRYYPRSAIKAQDPIRAILTAAERNGQSVFLSAGNHLSIMDDYGRVMEELHELYGKYKSFYGWYFPVEPTVARPLAEFEWFLKLAADIRRKADQLAPVKPLLVSVALGDYDFINDILHTGLHRELYQYFKAGRAPFNIIAPMDSVGCAELALDRVQSFYSVLRDACRQTPLHVWANAESFDADDARHLAPRFRGGGFAGPRGLLQQIACERPYAEKVITFEMTGFWAKPGLPPELGGPQATTQYAKYRAYMANPPPVFKNIALGKKYSRSAPPNFPGRKKLAPERRDPFPCAPDMDGTTATDGMLCSGMAHGAGHDLMFGYYVMESGKVFQVDITVDLEQVCRVDLVRCSQVAAEHFSADRIAVFAGNDGKSYRQVGAVDVYLNGWLTVPAGMECRFVKVRFFKSHQRRSYAYKNDENFACLIVDEIEILQQIGGAEPAGARQA